MGNMVQLALLRSSVESWNDWRRNNPGVEVDLNDVEMSWAYLYGANLREAHLTGANLTRADLRGADLTEAHLGSAILHGAYLRGANLTRADLRGAHLNGAHLESATLHGGDLREAHLNEADLRGADLGSAALQGADLCKADLTEADLHGADLTEAHLGRATLHGADLHTADLTRADLRGADLTGAVFVDARLVNAILDDCKVYGISAWNLQLDGATQSNLCITPPDEPAITVDDLRVAQFLYLVLNNQEIRTLIDTLTSKVVLILGRFSLERKPVLDALREPLRARGYVPVLFDFKGSTNQTFSETITFLARMARFIIADLTDPSSVSAELDSIVPHVHVPVRPIIAQGNKPYPLFHSLRIYPWMLKVHKYSDRESLIATIGETIIAPAEAKRKELHASGQADESDDG